MCLLEREGRLDMTRNICYCCSLLLILYQNKCKIMMKMMHLRRDLNLEIATDDDGGNKLPLYSWLQYLLFNLQFQTFIQ